MTQYNIVGDTPHLTGCLVMPCGEDKENAEDILYRMEHSPTPTDLRMTTGFTNLRVVPASGTQLWDNINMSDF